MTPLAPIAQQIWEMKYRLKDADGTPRDHTIEDSWARVAGALAVPERQPEQWAPRFQAAMRDFRFLPAGRILAGAGTGRKVTLFNCFVMGTVPDDMTGIFEHLKEAALTMQQGGGIGYDFSTLRPKGAPVKGVGADASGPLSFMDVWDAMCRTIMSAGFRRGAMMATLSCDHPDIEAFIAAKQDPGRLRMFNLSVLVSDAFMAAVKADQSWELKFNGTTWRTVRARDLWDQIMRATYGYAEPGVIFIDRINARNNLAYCENIRATNPCVTAETWVQTAEGPRQVAELVGRGFDAMVDGVAHRSGGQGFFSTGRKPVLSLRTREGHALRLTADHPVLAVAAATRWRLDKAWRKAGELRPGDQIMLHDHGRAAEWTGEFTEAQGYLIGLLIGDGTLKSDKAVLSAWPAAACANGEAVRDGTLDMMDAALTAVRTLTPRADFVGWQTVAGRGERRLVLGALRHLAGELGMAPGEKPITPRMERASAAFQRGVLRGLFDCDGAVLGTQAKGVSVRLAQSGLPRLEAAQRMLLRFGVVSRIENDGLVIEGANVVRYAECIGFAHGDKRARLAALISGYRRAVNRERFVAIVESIAPDGEAEVFDVQVPGVNAFDANGLVVHNCGEQPLPPYGACLLGSINLARLVREPFTEHAQVDLAELDQLARIAVRMMDNTIDVSNFPLEAQAHEARAKRRIGLGVTGLADALILCRARYGSRRSIELTREWLRAMRRAAYLASADLAAEKGAFPLYDRDAYLGTAAAQEWEPEIRAAIAEKGIRNALLTSIAPTGTISIFADNVSSGLEPVFSFAYTRSVLLPDGSRKDEAVTDHALRLYRAQFGEASPLPDYFVDAQTLAPADHVRIQAAAQEFIDSSISKTINCPEDIAFEAFKDVYQQAYDQGCKGCTTYRPNPVTGSVLSVEKPEAAPAKPSQPELPLAPPSSRAATARPRDPLEAGAVVYMTKPLDRPEVLPGQTYKVKWPESDHAIYITINDVVQDGRRRPFEVFINSKNTEHYAWTVALTRMISAVFRRGGDVSFVVEELKAVFDPRGGQWMGGRYIPSLLAAIGEVIEQHLIAIGFIQPPESHHAELQRKVANAEEGPPRDPRLRQCPRCGSLSLTRIEGCDTCLTCAYSKCG